MARSQRGARACNQQRCLDGADGPKRPISGGVRRRSALITRAPYHEATAWTRRTERRKGSGDPGQTRRPNSLARSAGCPTPSAQGDRTAGRHPRLRWSARLPTRRYLAPHRCRYRAPPTRRCRPVAGQAKRRLRQQIRELATPLTIQGRPSTMTSRRTGRRRRNDPGRLKAQQLAPKN